MWVWERGKYIGMEAGNCRVSFEIKDDKMTNSEPARERKHVICKMSLAFSRVCGSSSMVERERGSCKERATKR
jgi:hypothetical protein